MANNKRNVVRKKTSQSDQQRRIYPVTIGNTQSPKDPKQ
jgi:hypothetical protein